MWLAMLGQGNLTTGVCVYMGAEMPRGCRATNGWRKKRVRGQWKAEQEAGKHHGGVRLPRMDSDRMPIGKFKGKLIAELPQDYLEWFIENANGFDNIKAKMRYHVKAVTSSNP